MGLGGLAASRADALSALSWLVEAGVDTLVGDAPYPWLAAPAPPVIDAPAEKRAERPASRTERPAPPSADSAEVERRVLAADSLDALKQAAATLRAKPIFADGDPASGVMIIGQDAAPDDDRTGRPFSGPSGALLDRMLAAIGRDRSSVYLTNLYLWRSVGGSLSPEETRLCTLILRRHIEMARPRALLLMGEKPTKALVETDVAITKLRGTWTDLTIAGKALPTLITVNPAYLLRQPAAKALAWADLRAFKSRIDA
ncbi:uracil-DNA glycosylase [Sphingoaurantiacus capsulatus]|uniref:Uracil-DNA glycosylase n=1 Tax=Sphingoaurantiacus capsulatus TaxID=1771310 RepID=A0ABV7XBP4_9SPHN